MPIYVDLRENEVLGPPYIRGLQEGEIFGFPVDRKSVV